MSRSPDVGIISNDKRHLGIGRPGNSVIAADGDQVITMLGHQSQAVDIIDMGEPLRLSSRQSRMHEEKPPVHRLRRQMFVEFGQLATVVWANGAQVDGIPCRRLNVIHQFEWIAV